YEQRIARERVVLIVDIGGGTSDFTVVRLGPGRAAVRDRHGDILATTGIHIGGTDYDRRLSIDCAMPLLGLRHRGPSGREVPSPVFFDLSTWHLINWLYAPKALRQAQDLRTSYADTRLHDRLMRVLSERLGHRLASEVEQAKIRNSVTEGATRIELSSVEAGLAAPLEADAMGRHLGSLFDQVVTCARECVRLAALPGGQPDALYLTGGSSALRPFQQALRCAFPESELVEGDLFGGVASGLAYAGARR
ncbi:MAG TPA: Hsp70 family protein, partial [Ramlibacter sp.]|nr:Hsp70 family protein [Ramlibacter sp.]